MQHLNLAKRLNFMIAIHLYFLASMFVSITFWMVCQAPDCLWSKLGSRIVFSCTLWLEHLTDPTLVTPHLQHCNITIGSLEHIFSNYYQDWMSCNQMMAMWIRRIIDRKSFVTNIVRINHRSFITVANMTGSSQLSKASTRFSSLS